jgi:predicted  nucleic acid-binding Zn-ribbon protein
MRVLIVMHGWLPDTPRAVSGGAIRAWNHGEALKGAGHEVVYLTRTQDKVKGGPKVFSSADSLKRQVKKAKPDRILCVQPEEAVHLGGLGIPLCVDFYAPRLLESAFEKANAHASELAAVDTIRALTASDHQLFSNPRQRWYYLGLMTLAGIDVAEASGSVVPLVAPKGPRRSTPKEPLFVMGGVAWPWQDSTEALERTVRFLNKKGRGRLIVYGGKPPIGDTTIQPLQERVPPGDRLQYADAVPWKTLLKAYSGATAALDLMAENAERELALSFRHVDYMGCGLPIITGTAHALAPELAQAQAGWLVENGSLEKTLEQIFNSPDLASSFGRNAKKLAQTQFSREACEAPLLAWVEEATVRDKKRELLPERADLAADVAALKAKTEGAQALQGKAERELSIKRDEVVQLTAQVNALTTIVDRLSKAVDEVAGFKREAIAVLGAEKEAKSAQAVLLSRELAELGADLAKKQAESKATTRERDRLAADLEDSKENAERLQERLALTAEKGSKLQAESSRLRAELDAVRAERDRLQADNESLKAQTDSLQDETSKKGLELAEANSELHRVHDKAGRFESELDRVNRELAAARKENERLSRRKLF